MNNQFFQNDNNMFSTRTVVNFPFLNADSLSALINTLGFRMGLSELRFCQDYFKEQHLNNPTIHELKVIDRVFYDYSKSVGTVLVTSFMTNDEVTAETYADLMTRRNAVSPEYAAPCSIPEMLSILPRYLGKNSGGEMTVFGGKHRNLEISATKHKKIAETGTALNDCAAGFKIKTPVSQQNVSSGDCVYAVLKSFNNFDDFNARLERLMESPQMVRSTKKIKLVDNQSIITVLSSLQCGVSLNTIPYEGKDNCVSPFEHFTEEDFGVIAMLSKSNAADLLIAAQYLGIIVIPLGTVIAQRKIQAISRMGEHFSLPQPLLRSLAFSRASGCEADGNTPDIAEKESSVYINVNGKRHRMNSACCGGKNNFMAGFNSVLYSYSLCTAGGATQTMGTGVYTLPLESISDKSVGTSVELILGAYRAQCMLELADVNPKIEFGKAPSLAFHTLSDAPFGLPEKFVGTQTSIYYLEPLYGDDGLPVLQDMMKMYSYVKKLIQNREVLSIHPTTENIYGLLEKMGNGAPLLYVSDEKLSSRFGGFIIETTKEIQGKLIAKTPIPTPPSALSDTNFSL